MEPFRIRETFREFLTLVEVGAGSAAEREARLALLLDRLALAQHDLCFDFDDTEYPDAPDSDYEALYKLLGRRFPSYGYYNVALKITEEIGVGECGVDDAIDDLADITADLHRVEWCWSNTSEANALWFFQNDYRHHWGEHLRCLQLYLHALRSGS